MPKISTIIIAVTVIGLIYSSIRRNIAVKKQKEQGPVTPEFGPYKVPWWERVLQIFLVFATAAYALWVLGIRKFINDEIAKGGDLRPLIITLVVSVLFIAGLYFFYLFANWQQIKAGESKQSPKERFIGYLKIVGVWIFLVAIDLIFNR